MAKKFLDNIGLSLFWLKIKSYIDEHDFKLNYNSTGKNYKVSADNKNLYVSVPWTDTKYENATATNSGLMSNTDKSKLDGIDNGANNYIHPTTSGNKHIPPGGSSGQVLKWSADGTAIWSNDDSIYEQANSTTLGLVKIGYIENDKNYPVELNSSGQMFVNVPWIANDKEYTLESFGVLASADELNKLDGCAVTTTEINYLDGVTSNIQIQLNEKADNSHVHILDNLTDLNNEWDILLKVKPNEYITRWPTWHEISNKPSTFTPDSHIHDDRYYTEAEVNSKLDEKANKSGTYNDLNVGYATHASYIDRDRGMNIVTTLSDLPVSKSLIRADLTTPTSISLSSDLNIGEFITIICNPGASFVQPLPNSGSWYSMDGDSLKISAGKKFEINILCYSEGMYSISCKQSK